MNVEELKKAIRGRDVYIWGTRIAGLSAAKLLPMEGIDVRGFIDSIPCWGDKLSLQVLNPRDIFEKNLEKIFIIVCTRSHSPHIIKTCIENGVSKDAIVEWEALQRFDYYIEINNKCNLSCLTCSAREYYNEALVNMTVSDFEAILEKIRMEDPLASWINLFGHNEAFLNDSLPEMIELADKLGFAVGLSTNLAFAKDFENVIKARPLWVRVSMSGWGKSYEVIHRGGKFDVLIKNLHLLSKYRNMHTPDMLIEVFFHRYRHNGNDIEKVRGLCDKLGFEFRTIYASIIGLETVSNLLDNRVVSRKTQRALPYLCFSVEDTARMAFQQKEFPCPNDHLVRIHSDMTVAACQAWMGSVIPGVRFTEISFDELERRLMQTQLCPLCKPRGLHQFCEIVFDENHINKKNSRIQ